RLAEEAKARAEAAARQSAPRIPRPPSAREALERAPAAAAEAARTVQPAPPRAEPRTTPPPPPPAPDPAPGPGRRLPGAEVVEVRVVRLREAFRALWTAHRVRALADDDVPTVVTADVLLDAASRVPEGALAAAHVRRGGRDYAVFVDLASGMLLGAT